MTHVKLRVYKLQKNVHKCVVWKGQHS